MEVVFFGSIGALLSDHGEFRPGVARTIQEARAAHQRIGLITSVASRAIDWIGACSRAGLSVDDFDLVLERGHGESLSTTYGTALSMLGADPVNCVFVVSSSAGAVTAVKIGAGCILTPGNPDEHAPGGAEVPVVSCLGDVTESAEQFAGRPVITHGIVTLRNLVDLRRQQTLLHTTGHQTDLLGKASRYSTRVALRKTA